MPTYSASSADSSVVAQAYAAATKLTTDPKILLALFEAGMVESNFHNNTTATDHDSLGYLQQRPSQGWPNPTDIPTATKSFITKAKAKLAANPGLTADQLAQAVQVSAYPERYGQAQSAAADLLNKSSNGGLSGFLNGVINGITGVATAPANVLDGIADSIRSAFAPLASVGKLSDQAMKAFMPTNIVRICAGIGGAAFLIIGIYLLTREARNA